MRASRWCGRLSLAACLIGGSATAQVLQYGDRAPDEMQTVGDPGMLILFDAGEEGRWLNAIEVYASSPGGAPAGEELQLYVIDLDGRPLRRALLPYVVLTHTEDGWCRLPLPPMVVPQQFGVGLVGSGNDTRYLRGQRDVFFAMIEVGGWGGSLNVGLYGVKESHSYRWSPGTPGEGLWDRDWMVRAYVSTTADGDPEAGDLVVLRSGEAFLDRVLAAEGDPLEVRTAGHGAIPRDEVASLRMQAVTSPAAATAVVVLTNGTGIEGALESMTEDTVAVRQAQRLITVARSDVARIEFPTVAAVPVGPQVAPQASDTRRAWGAEQATGPRDTLRGGDMQTAWASRTPDGQEEWLLLGYETAVDIAEVRVWETYNPGAVVRATALADDDTETTLWEGDDPTTEAPGEFVVTVDRQAVAKRVKLYLDSVGHHGWNEIDAVELVGKDGTRQWAATAGASSSYADR